MTDKTPAMPEPLHLFEFWWQAHMPQATQAQAWSAWTAAQNCKGETIESALQSAQPAEVSDARIMGCIAEHEVYQGRPGALLHFARAILALRPQAVPMTDEQLCAALGIDGSDDWTYKVRDAVEAHHGITQRADGGEKQA